VKALPVTNLSNRLASTALRLRNGQVLPGLLAGVDLQDAFRNQQLLGLSIWHEDRWFHLVRSYDHEFAKMGPAALAARLGLPVEQVFPIVYDISGWAKGLPDVVRGEVTPEPEPRLSEAEKMDLIFGRYKKK